VRFGLPPPRSSAMQRIFDEHARLVEQAKKSELAEQAKKSECQGKKHLGGISASISPQSVLSKIIPPIQWVIPGYIPEKSVTGIAGASGVGKTRWLTSLVAGLVSGRTEMLGLPESERTPVLWFANEEREEDVVRRLKACFLHYDIDSGDSVNIVGSDMGGIRLVGLGPGGAMEIDKNMVKRVVEEVERTRSKVVIFDPYVTFSEGMNENEAFSVAHLRRAFRQIVERANVAVIFTHHAAKRDSAKQGDWYRGQETAFRGSGDIVSQLDMGFTLSPWWPPHSEKDKRDEWEEYYVDFNLSRFIELVPCKVREGYTPKPVVYEMVGQEMMKEEGSPIGVCSLSSQEVAYDAVSQSASDVVDDVNLAFIANKLVETFGPCAIDSATRIHQAMQSLKTWPSANLTKGGYVRVTRELEDLFRRFRKPFYTHGFTVQFDQDHRGKWVLKILREDS